MKAMYDLTVIIPHYNTPSYLKMLLESIPVRENVQVIVVDDKSSADMDKYLEIKRDAAFGHVTFLDNTTEKKGPGVCRNIGLEHAVGTWVLFCDADDFLVDGFYSVAEKYIPGDYDIVYFTPTSAERDSLLPAERHLAIRDIIQAYRESPTLKNELSLKYRLTAPWSKMIRNEIIKEHRLCFDELMVSEDVKFAVRAGYHARSIAACEDVIYCVTDTAGSLMKTISEEYYDMSLDAFIWQYHYLRRRLSKKEFKLLGLCAAELFIFKVIKYGFGFRKLFSVLKLLRKNKVKIVTLQYVNPAFLFTGLRRERGRFLKSRRFFVSRS